MLFTDIEGSTRLARMLGDQWPEVLSLHHMILRTAIGDVGGHVEGTDGDAFFAVFATADAAVVAATSAQRVLHAQEWPAGDLLVRMGLHTADVDRFNDEYVGLEVHRAARVAAVAHGGQVILTGATYAALTIAPPCDDLGAHRLKDFPEPTPLLHLVVDGRSAGGFPPPKTLDVLPTNLPPTDIDPVGRDTELEAVRSAFLQDGVRIVTVTGLGGAGKTTTALAVARSVLDDYPGGVWLVRAEALTDADQLLAAIGEVLWLRDRPGVDPLSALIERLTDRRVLLVLDNLEHIEGAAGMVAGLVRRAPLVALLVTSRAPLRLTGERVVTLGPLSLDAAKQLVSRRAEALGAALGHLSDSDRSALDELCGRLEGLPLALELMAPRLRLFSPGEVLVRLGAVADITTTAADRPERQRSLRATVEWSVGLLPDEPAALLRRLTTFDGPAPVDMVEDVCCWDFDVAEPLAVLLDYSLVQRRLTGFSLVTAVREVVAEQLVASGEEQLVRRRHAIAMAALAERGRKVTATDQERRIGRALRIDAWTATEWARTHDAALHRRLVTALAKEWAVSGQLRRALDEVRHQLALEGTSPVERGELLCAQSYAFALAMRPEEAVAAAEEATRLLQDAPLELQAGAFIVLCQARNAAGLLVESRDAARVAVDRLRDLDDQSLLARGLVELAQAELGLGDLDGTRAALDEAAARVDGRHNRLLRMLSEVEADLALACGDLYGAIDANTRMLDDDFDYSAWAVAAMTVAVSRLGDAKVALELGTIATLMAADLGTDVSALTQTGEDVPTAIARARSSLSAADAAAAERAGHQRPAGQRLARARELGRLYSRSRLQ